MRVYHFLCAKYGLQAIEDRRLKVSRWGDLNDPFEYFSLDVTDRQFRRTVQLRRRHVHETTGLICFSRSWKNPVQWSHYADRHRGLCLGFDVNDNCLSPVKYAEERIKFSEYEMNIFLRNEPEKITDTIYTKYHHWQYEEELRMLTTLHDLPTHDGLYFQPFDGAMNLREIIVGATNRSTSKADLNVALGANRSEVNMFKARASFSRFEMVRQGNASLWA
jgi:hypothetical protein